jgi:hypothetical protein
MGAYCQLWIIGTATPQKLQPVLPQNRCLGEIAREEIPSDRTDLHPYYSEYSNGQDEQGDSNLEK